MALTEAVVACNHCDPDDDSKASTLTQQVVGNVGDVDSLHRCDLNHLHGAHGLQFMLKQVICSMHAGVISVHQTGHAAQVRPISSMPDIH